MGATQSKNETLTNVNLLTEQLFKQTRDISNTCASSGDNVVDIGIEGSGSYIEIDQEQLINTNCLMETTVKSKLTERLKAFIDSVAAGQTDIDWALLSSKSAKRHTDIEIKNRFVTEFVDKITNEIKQANRNIVKLMIQGDNNYISVKQKIDAHMDGVLRTVLDTELSRENDLGVRTEQADTQKGVISGLESIGEVLTNPGFLIAIIVLVAVVWYFKSG